MAAQGTSNVRAVLIEYVDRELPMLFRQEYPLWDKIQQVKPISVSRRTMRVPLKMSPGGQFRAYTPDGGVLGTGTGIDYEHATLVPSDHLLAMEWTKDVDYTTDDGKKAVAQAVKDLTVNGMEVMKQNLNAGLHCAGAGVLATVSSVASLIITVSGNYGTLLLSEGLPVDFYDSGYTTNRGTANITAINSLTTFTVDAVPSGVTGTDLVSVSGMTAAGSVSGAPVDLFGVDYHHNDAVTGMWLGLNRATYAPKLSTPSVDASSADISPALLRATRAKMRRALGLSKSKARHLVLMNQEQAIQYESLAIQVQRVDRTPSGGEKVPDMNFDEDLGNVIGYPVLIDQHQDPTRVDILNLAVWGRAELYPLRYYTDNNGNKFFTLVDTSTGTPKAAELCYLQYGGQFFMRNPRDGAYLKNLSKPTTTIFA
jgi:hypothetical protein